MSFKLMIEFAKQATLMQIQLAPLDALLVSSQQGDQMSLW
jgi:hypothetical protein